MHLIRVFMSFIAYGLYVFLFFLFTARLCAHPFFFFYVFGFSDDRRYDGKDEIHAVFTAG
jgi:hypothetical protein